MSSKDTKLPTNENGVKLPYFHRKLTEEDSNLIGDITPKRIDSVDTSIQSNSGALSKSSAWNAASTWEERDCSKWAKENLTKLFKENDSLIKDELCFSIDDVKDINGHAEITHSRGKVRYLYEFNLKLSLNVTNNNNDDDICTGLTIQIDDIINDLLDDIELSIEWGSSNPSKNYINIIKSVINKEFKNYVIKILGKFEESYRKL